MPTRYMRQRVTSSDPWVCHNQDTAQADKLPEDDLIKILRQSGLHGAGGPSRWRKGLLVGLLGQPTAAQAWTQFMTLQAQG